MRLHYFRGPTDAKDEAHPYLVGSRVRLALYRLGWARCALCHRWVRWFLLWDSSTSIVIVGPGGKVLEDHTDERPVGPWCFRCLKSGKVVGYG